MYDNPIFYGMVLTINVEARKTVEKFGHGEITLKEGKCMLAVLRKVVDTGLKTAYEKRDEDTIKGLHHALLGIDYHESILQKIEYEKRDALRKIMDTIEY